MLIGKYQRCWVDFYDCFDGLNFLSCKSTSLEIEVRSFFLISLCLPILFTEKFYSSSLVRGTRYDFFLRSATFEVGFTLFAVSLG